MLNREFYVIGIDVILHIVNIYALSPNSIYLAKIKQINYS
jgi:hypothetical protein